jgi:uncharacterized protein YjbI with pentapeptide repeats
MPAADRRLYKINLSHAYLAGVDLSGADLLNAELTGTLPLDANLEDANLTGSTW